MIMRAFGIGACLLLLPFALFAQELRFAGDSPTIIDDGEAYTAYYGELSGKPHVFEIHAMNPLRLSVIILTPKVEGARTDFSATVFNQNALGQPIIELDGTASEWRWFFDTEGRDEYLAGPVLRGGLPPGVFEVRVSNPDNEGKYVLVLGEDSWKSGVGLISRYQTLPRIKTEFFGKPAYQAFLTPLLMWPVIALLAIIAIAVFALYILKRRRVSAALAPHIDS